MADAATPASTTVTATEGADSYADFSEVFDSLTGKEGAEDAGTQAQTNSEDGTAGAAADDSQSSKPADGAGGAEESAAAGGNAAAANGEGSQGSAGDDAAGGKPQSANDVTDPNAATIAELQRQLAELQAARTAAPAEPAAPAPKSEPPAIYTPEETTELANLQKEWPDLARLFSLMARQMQYDTLTYAFKEVERVVTPLQTSVASVATNDHWASIYEAHEDYDKALPSALEWIEKQPSFIKAAYQNVAKNGTAQEVIDLVSQFKKETNWQAPAATPPAAKAAPAPAPAGSSPPAELSDAAKKAASAIGAVGTKRSGGMTAQDPSDFDGAWAEITATK